MKREGFSLVEVLVAILLIGLALAALAGGNMAFTNSNGIGTDLSNAEFLLEQIKELTTLLPVFDPQTGTATFGPEEAALADYDDLDDLNGANFSPPISADRQVLSELAGFSQQVTVENVSDSNFELVVANHSSDFVRVTAKVFLNSVEVSSASWVRARY